jgi:glucose-6-phosphate 1-dehydrogenase
MNNTFGQTIENPTAITIFGATGSLSTSKLFPALLDLYTNGLLPDEFRILGISRQSFTNDEFRKFLQNNVPQLGDLSSKQRKDFLAAVRFESGDVTVPQTYGSVYNHLNTLDDECGACLNKLFYLALPPRFYADVGSRFGNSKLMSLCDSDDVWLRLLVEKPYGTDLETAETIDEVLCDTFSSDQLFRIDHYLAKQALQNVITLRFRNQLFSGSWNNQFIKEIHVKMYEQATVEGRGGFYDNIGAFRDVGQNHLLQLLAATTMEPPENDTTEAMRTQRAEIFSRLQLAEQPNKKIIRGQYEGYRQTDGVSEDSKTETYFRLSAEIASGRWRGVPIVIESGKGMAEDRVEIEITFRESIVRYNSVEPTDGNTLVLQFKPKQGIAFDIWTESPQLHDGVVSQAVDFLYSPESDEPPAYTALLYQAMHDDKVMFASNEEVTASWEFTEKATRALTKQQLQSYSLGASSHDITKQHKSN